jgi:hypothetical protein
MNGRNILIGTALLWVAIVAIVLWERHVAKLNRALLVQRASEHAIALKEIEEIAKSSDEKRKTLARLERTEAANQTAKGTRKNPSAREQIEGDATTIAKNPSLRDAYMRGFVADLYTRWGLYFRQQGMTPEQIAQFNGIQIRLEDAKLDLAAKALAENLSPDDPELADELAQANHEFYKDLTDLIGRSNYSVYKAYSQEGSVITLVNDLPGYISADAQPLTDAQSLQLAQILADSSTKNSSGWVKYGTVNWGQAMPLAQAVLTPAQFEALQLMEATKLMAWQKDQSTGP